MIVRAHACSYADADSTALGGRTNTSAQLVPIGAVPDTSGQMGLASFRELKRELRATSRLMSAPPYAVREAEARPSSGFKMRLSIDDLPGVRPQVLPNHEAERPNHVANGYLTGAQRVCFLIILHCTVLYCIDCNCIYNLILCFLSQNNQVFSFAEQLV